MQPIKQLVQEILEHDAVQFMADALLYYNSQHNLTYLTKDEALILRASSSRKRKTKPVPYETMKNLYDYYLCGMEEKHRYYWNMVQNKTPKKRRLVVGNKQRSNRISPYNLFIKTQWKERKNELEHIKEAHDGRIIDVMKILSKEWSDNNMYKNTGDPEKDGKHVKSYFQQRAQLLNTPPTLPEQQESSL